MKSLDRKLIRDVWHLRGQVAAVALVAACGPGAGSASPAVPGSASADASAPRVALTVGLGFIPSVQFAQFYLADQAGYYDEAGLDVTFQNKIDPDLVTLVGQGSIDVGLADGTSVIPAVSNGIPIKYVATIYGKFPSVVFAKASSGIWAISAASLSATSSIRSRIASAAAITGATCAAA